MPDGSYETYAYNADGLRTIRSLYTAQNQLQKKFEYFWSDGVLIGSRWSVPAGMLGYQFDHSETVKLIYDDGEAVGFVFEHGGGSYPRWFSKNLQGDITGVYDEMWNEIVRYSYDAWGNRTVVSGSSYWDFVWMLGYRGYQFDAETGLYYCQSRYYNGNIGRWLNADEIEILGLSADKILGTNLFAYANNNPVNYKDENECNDEIINLAGLNSSDEKTIYQCIEKFAKQISEKEKYASKDKVMYLLLNWLFDNKDKFENPSMVLDIIYDDFGFPKSIEHLISYMPMKNTFGFGKHKVNLYDRWKQYLDSQKSIWGA